MNSHTVATSTPGEGVYMVILLRSIVAKIPNRKVFSAAIISMYE